MSSHHVFFSLEGWCCMVLLTRLPVMSSAPRLLGLIADNHPKKKKGHCQQEVTKDFEDALRLGT